MRPNFLFGLEFFEGWVFGRVVRRRNLHYKPYFVINSSGTKVVLATASTQSQLRFLDPRNQANDILYLGDYTKFNYPWFLYGAIGIKQPDVYLYLHSPEGGDIDGRFPNLDPVNPANGDKFAYVSSIESPYEDPTDFTELTIVPNMRVSGEYYNKSADLAINPQLNLLFNLYFFEILNGVNNSLVGKIARREVQSSFLKVGFGDEPIRLGATVSTNWNVTPVALADAEGMR